MDEIKLTFLCHADFSGRIRKSREDIGFCAFHAEVERLRAHDPEGTLLLDAGDAFCTNYWGGLPLVRAMERNGTDAMVLGNHEFDRGRAFLEECIAACPFPVLCANVRKRTGEPIPGTKPYVLLKRCGVQIGILGLTTEYTPYMVEASAFSEFEMTSAAQAAERYIPQLRAQGAEVVVVLTHMPFYMDGGTLSGELIDLIKASPEADVWVGGHIPGDVACCLDGACVVKAGFGGASIARAELTLDAQTLNARLSKVEQQLASGVVAVKAGGKPEDTDDGERPPFPDDADDPFAGQPVQDAPEEQTPRQEAKAEPVGFWPELARQMQEGLSVRERGFFSPDGPVSATLRGDVLLLAAENEFVLGMVKKPAIEQLAREKAAAVLGRPVQVRFVLKSQVAGNSGEDPLERLVAFGREHADIFTIK